MNATKTLTTAALVALLGTTAACGGSSSSGGSGSGGSSAAGAAGSPKNADPKTFCSTLANIPQDATPKEAVARVQKIGTPSDATTQERKGYETLLNTLAKLPDATKASLSQIQGDISSADKADVQAFFTYFLKTCKPTGTPSQ